MDSSRSLTGNEFLDFLSWCEIVGIDFEENKKDEEKETKEQNTQRLIKKMKGRDKNE